MHPIADHRTIIGQATTAKQAENTIRKLLTIDKRMSLRVWLRDKDMADILGLPVAWVYSIHYTA